MKTPSFAGNDAPDRQLRGVAPLIALAAAVLVGAIVAWRQVLTNFDAVPQEADFVNLIILGGSTLLLLLLLLSAIFLRSRRHGAFIETISVFSALSFLAMAGDALILVVGVFAHVAVTWAPDPLASVGPRQTDLADAIVNIALLFVVSHIVVACLGIDAMRRARAARTLAAAPQPTRATGSQDSSLTAATPLTYRDRVAIREFLQRRGSLEPLRREQLATVIATEIHRHIGGEPPCAPEPYLEQLASAHGLYLHHTFAHRR
jgi:hypothetical protein